MKVLFLVALGFLITGCNTSVEPQTIKGKFTPPSLYDKEVFSCKTEGGVDIALFNNPSAYVWTLVKEPMSKGGKPGIAYAAFTTDMETGYYETGGNSVREIALIYPPYEFKIMQGRLNESVIAHLVVKDNNSGTEEILECAPESIDSNFHDEDLFQAIPPTTDSME